jgi:aspartate kinase
MASHGFGGRTARGARPAARGALVIKFGGTSVANAARVRRAARRVLALRGQGWRTVVVVSAAGQATDRLLSRLHDVTADERRDAESWSASPFAREIDRALASAEDRSAAILAAALCAGGAAARSVRAHEAVLRADGPHGAATLASLDPGAIAESLVADIIPVVSGFQGARADGELVTLGRGSSDTTAVFIAAALGAAECHIVTDVAGVYDRDPRLAPEAVLFPELASGDLVSLCESGARVVHPEAARRAHASGTALRVYHHRAPLSGETGTRVPAVVA